MDFWQEHCLATVRITEIFYSLQGEARTIGLPTVFVRLTGCPLRCQYCDTTYSFSGGELQDLSQIVAEVSRWKTPYVTVTGGEPLAQPNVHPLMQSLCDQGFEVSLETSGALPIDEVDPRVSVVLDLKTPDSAECHRNLYENIALLKHKDQVKFVVCSRSDYEWARFKVDEYRLTEKAGDVLFSPSHGEVLPTELADWILADRLNVRFQLQLHKILWADEPGR